MSLYTHTTTLHFLGLELEATFEFDVDWGTPERGAFGPVERYDPGSPAVATFVRFTRLRGEHRDYPCDHLRAGTIVGDYLLAQVHALDLLSLADMQEAA